MKTISGFTRFFCTLFFLFLIFQSCKKDEELGFEVQPTEDKIIVGFNNNSGLIAYTVREDSVRSDETLLNLLGSYFDPVFGTSAAGINVQFRLPDNDFNFGDNAGVDSIVLSLAYGGFYGNLATTQSVHVYEINQDFYIDSSYYSNKRLSCLPTDLCNQSFLPKPHDSVTLGGLNYAPHLRLRLTNTFGQKFINASPSDLANNPNFILFFKGLYIVAEPSYVNGAMLYFSLLNNASKLTLYYHNDANDSLSYSFIINENSARFNTFEHFGYSGANHDFQQQIAGDTSRGEQTLYLQAMSGVKTFIRFPDLKNLLNPSNVVINKAELIITVNPTGNENYTPPGQLTLVKINNDGTLSFLPDEFYGSNYFGGTYNISTGEYRFNIATYTQNLLAENDYAGKGLYLAISGSSVKGDLLTINGPSKESSNLRLEITYTRIN